MGDSQKIVRAFRDGELIETWVGDAELREDRGAKAYQIARREYYLKRIEEILDEPDPPSSGSSIQIYDELIAPLLEEDRG